MTSTDAEYVSINRTNWDERAPIHAASPDYAFEQFISNPEFISDVVKFDQPLLGDMSGLKCVHLQCHIGTDSLSLARLGAASVTGLDFSSASVAEARKLAEATVGSGGEKLNYVQGNVYDALKILPPASFDFVFTGIGALCWLHSVREWAKVVSGLLRPGGRLFIREGHPMLWVVDNDDCDEFELKYSYFEGKEPIVYTGSGTYVETNGHVFASSLSHQFNHGLGEIIQSLLDAGMRITGLKEHTSVPWDALPGLMTKLPTGEWHLTDRPERLPHSYTLRATKEL